MLLILAFLLVASWPLLRGEFVFNDDSMICEMEGNWTTHPQIFFLISIGRISHSLLSFPVWSFPELVEDLRFLRFMNILTLSLAAFLFCNWLQKRSIDLIPAALLTVVTFSLPCFQSQEVVVSAFPSMIGLVVVLGIFFQ